MSLKIHSYCDDAKSVFGLMSEEECHHWIERTEAIGFDEAPINTTAGEVRISKYRNNARVMIDDSGLANLLWDRIRSHVPSTFGKWRAKGLNERFRFYRYEKYQQFRRHSDGAYARSSTEESRLTFMVYLNQDFSGGFTEFDNFKVWPETGMGLWFKHSLPHEGAIVTEGVKYALRSDVMYEVAQ